MEIEWNIWFGKNTIFQLNSYWIVGKYRYLCVDLFPLINFQLFLRYSDIKNVSLSFPFHTYNSNFNAYPLGNHQLWFPSFGP